jgi:predicted ATPase/DNA-binding SARP family transcriptional activator
MGTLFRLEMLGRLVVQRDSRQITRFRTQKTAALLAYLAFYRQRSHPRDFFIELLWPDSALEAARTNLSVALNALRHQLEGPDIPPGAILMADRLQVRLHPDAFTTDVAAFESLLQRAEGETEFEKRISLQRQALDLYQGDLLPGFYEDWILTERDRLRDLYLSTLRKAVKGYAEIREYECAIECSHRMVQADPLREGAYHNLMRLYLAVGRPQDALHQYETLEHLLQKELQISPSAPLRELADKLRAAGLTPRPSLEGKQRERRLRETVSGADHPSAERPRPVVKLPFLWTRFFGREEEIARLIEMLLPHPPPFSEAEPSHRLVTLTGTGGTGKTRLAVETVRRMSDRFAGGIWFVSLADLSDSRLLGSALAEALDLPRSPATDPLEQATQFLQERHRQGEILLILDNFEQFVESGSQWVEALMAQVPGLCLLVTSRRSLGLPGEREYHVAPLTIPLDGDESQREANASSSGSFLLTLMQCPSVALFVDRAQAVSADFGLTARNAKEIAALCRRLEGLPLAIELAAARIRVMTPAQIRESMAHRFDLLVNRRAGKDSRHRSLHAVMEWSFHLLAPPVRRFFARLSVFAGGCTAEAAANACDETSALDYLEQLIIDSLLTTEETPSGIRFRMLETVREFAAEQLAPEGREEIERRHALYFHEWLMSADDSGSEQIAWFGQLDKDLDNVRAALAWSLREVHEIESGLEIAGALIGYWQARCYFSEGRSWYDRLLERAEETPTPGLGRALYGAGLLAVRQGDFQAAVSKLKQCLEIVSVLGDKASVALAQNELGGVAFSRGDYEQARFHYEKGLVLARALGKPRRVAVVLGNLANVALTAGEYPSARALQLESLKIRREVNDRFGEAIALHNLGYLAYTEKQLTEARTYYEQSLEIKRELANPYSISITLRGMADVAKAQGDYQAAIAYACESLALARELKARMQLVHILNLLISLVRERGEGEMAARMYGALETARVELDVLLDARDQESYDRGQRDLQVSLGSAVYNAVKTEGKKLSLEQALICLEERLASKSF